jgi:hypothetical protein
MPNHYYDAPSGFVAADKLTVIAKMEQPPEGWALYEVDTTLVTFTDGLDEHDSFVDVLLPYPRGARVGVREPWVHPGDPMMRPRPLAAFTMPDKAIRHWYTVTDIRVCRASEVTFEEAEAAGLRVIDRFPAPFTEAARYVAMDETKLPQLKATLTASVLKDKLGIKPDEWVEVVTMRREA